MQWPTTTARYVGSVESPMKDAVLRVKCPERIVLSCSHAYHMHCLLKWPTSKQQCPMDRRP
ncbi:hypothetical protein PISMIDRAFT_256696 [Pisolithus microcarpus 441]|uniref:Zinc finger RING-H2-type domain-containing protein n=1 Tax=Pisolithus microcarpus 441 TaxID=765257 RepID=A0A0C9YIU2_9AGAM|nr:hypothetical protein PISMIDRAFT_256696 [Pisolithus microcarpus 441]